ncbi:hypothetical protein BGZ51_005698 [Haplosporangium sp. Z 767]|nr:hypothetical protein BGZ50_007279 [Haplosporangium sp. Z 11]KAF9181055.1 hypothetical protein BGZ51_005698 [Haplosporangium sp. Z 767]
MSDMNPWNTSAASSHSTYIPSSPSLAPIAEPSAPTSPMVSSIYPSFTPSDTQQLHQNQENNQHEAFTTIPSAEAVSSTDSPYDNDDDSPPSYETVINKDIAQIHDTYEHLQGPPSQRGNDIKTAIPPESLPWSSNYQSAGAGSSSSSSNGSGPSGASSSFSHASAPPGPIYVATVVPLSTYDITHSPTTTQAPLLGLQGQIALGEEETENADDMDRLLGTWNETDSASEDDPSDKSCWSIAGNELAWINLGYMTFILLPWSCFCYAWTITVVMFAMIMMIIPPIGYFFTILAVTSWRALARADLALSSALVSDEIRQRYPFIKAQVYLEPEPGPAWTAPRLFGYELPLPGFIQRKMQSRHAARSRRPKGLWRRGSKHLKAVVNDRHTISSMFYFMIWKMMFAIPVFMIVVIYFCLTLPFMVCLLPSLLSMVNVFAKWQYQWAVCWLGEKASCKHAAQPSGNGLL